MYAHQLNLNLDKTETLFSRNCCPWPFCFHWGPNGNEVLNGALNCRKLECDTDDQLFFAANITATTRSCRLVLHNIRMICVLNAKKAVQVLRMQIAPAWPAYCMSSDMWSSFRGIAFLVFSHTTHCFLSTLAASQIWFKHWFLSTVLYQSWNKVWPHWFLFC